MEPRIKDQYIRFNRTGPNSGEVYEVTESRESGHHALFAYRGTLNTVRDHAIEEARERDLPLVQVDNLLLSKIRLELDQIINNPSE